ncbi:unnamed protein product [Closterium sp. Yama58-4]|nr:unnamed protein product [Closterium sp. Yama58-4]
MIRCALIPIVTLVSPVPPSSDRNVTIKEAFLAAALVSIAHSLNPVTISGMLYGINEIPKDASQAGTNVGDPTGVTDMTLKIYKRKGQPVWLEYETWAFDMVDNASPTMTHVHKAPAEENGPLVLNLPCKYEYLTENKAWHCNGTLGKKPAERTRTFVSVLKAISETPWMFYGNVHTANYPDGAVRDQLQEV